MKRVIAITGGIGAGKSVVSRVLAAMGFPVYDTDSAARSLMDADEDMRRRIAAEVTPSALNPDGSLNRPALAAVVFANPSALLKLNEIVHGAVRADFMRWVDSRSQEILFVETAILYESGFDALVGEVWEVTAPDALRIERVIKRSGLTANEIQRRIDAQAACARPGHRLIVNDNVRPVIPQILNLLS
ncbi:MAG: dephospho-CoA kinase [Muribaculaceae bacterium]|nr:dephospho-CoA kinase [Muribaculaceae bacterium]